MNMSFTQKLTRWSMMMMGVLLLSVGLTACGGGASVAEDTVPTTIMVGSSYVAPAPISGFVTRGNVDSADIDSIIVEITKVTVHRAGGDDVVEVNEDDSEPLDPDAEEAAGTSGWLTLFEANTPEENIVLDLVDL
jgi:hypothetical protein